jgi:heat-inducible transcriptional repressor
MMQKRQLSSDDSMFLQKMIIDNIYQIEFMMQATAKAISGLTRYPAIVSEPYINKTTIKHVQLVPLDEKSILLVLVTDTKSVKSQTINLQAAPGYEILTQLSFHMNTQLAGLSIREINRNTLNSLLHSFGNFAHILMPILGTISDIIHAEDDVRVFTSGVKNILTFPEFSDIRKAEAIFHALEDRASLMQILGQETFDGIQIAIGEENNLDLLKTCSLIKANYSLDNQSTGCIALIGPMRMDYTQAVSVLSGILQSMISVKHALGL